MLARLDSALALGKSKSDMSDLLIDVRKNELLSTIPWIDKALRKVELTPRLRRLLYQADLKWTVGGLADDVLCGLHPSRLSGLSGAPATSSLRSGSAWHSDLVRSAGSSSSATGA